MIDVCTVQARAARKIVDAAAQAGIESEELYQAVGLDPASLSDPDKRIPNQQLVALYEHAARLTGDDAFGLHVAERISPTAFDVLGYAALNSPTARQALHRLVRYYRIWTDGSKFDLETDATEARLTYSMIDPPTGRHECEFTLAITVIGLRSATGTSWTPREVWFQHAPPENTSEHRRIFRAPIRFAQVSNELFFHRSLLDAPIARADPNLCAVLDRHAEELLAKLGAQGRSQNVVDQVRQILSIALRGGDPGLEAIARQLRMSTRTLQRKLNEKGTSHQDLLDEMRRELSMRYLQEPEIAICEVAYLLGFSESSTFHRAFRRWTGLTPKEYRQVERQPGA
jgi:AraC-like DNA-binding protein